jgi:hypothetical protein
MPFIYRFLQEKRKNNACRELTKHIILKSQCHRIFPPNRLKSEDSFESLSTCVMGTTAVLCIFRINSSCHSFSYGFRANL